MDKFDCSTIKHIVKKLMAEKTLRGKLFVAGGIVPYIYSGEYSSRKHSDIDIVVELENMQAVRDYLKANGYYDITFDSVEFDYNTNRADHGLEAFIHDVPVNFAPFFVQGDNIVQRNFLIKELVGYDALVTVTMNKLAVQDYITTSVQPDGSIIGSYTIEMVKCAKESSNREKDIQDIHVIDRVGVNPSRYDRIKPVMESMKMTRVTPGDIDT